MRLWIIAEYDYDFKEFRVYRERPSLVADNAVAEVELNNDEAKALLTMQEAQDALQGRLGELYTAHAPKMAHNGKTLWGND